MWHRALEADWCVRFAFLAAMCGWGLACSAFGQSYLVKEGQTRGEIVVADHPPRMAQLAAHELQTYLEKISGARLPIRTDPSNEGPVQIYVGRSRHTDRLKVSDEGLEHGAFRMVSGPSWLVLLGCDRDFTPPKLYSSGHSDWPRFLREWDAMTGEKWEHPYYHVFKQYSKELGIWDYDERGSLNAVYEFLRQLGVRWYMPGELGEIVPKRPTIELPQIDKVIRPDFAYRQLGPYAPVFYGDSKQAILWRLRLGLAPGQELVGLGYIGHGTELVHHRDEVKKAHPEYYALYGGKRDTGTSPWNPGGRPCLSSPGLFESNVKFARAVFDISNPPMISVMPADGYVSLCQCELCKGKGTPERGYQGQLSDYVWDYVDRVARELYKTHPDKKVIGLAYGAYLLPPERIAKLSPNVAVGICQSRSGFSNPETWQQQVQLRQAWLKKLTSGDLYIYDYYLHSRPGKTLEGIPVFFPHAIARDLHWLKGISKGEFIELSRTEWKKGVPQGVHAPAFNHLNVYVTARLYWDADQDVEAMLEEYYANYYGPARQEMKGFVEYAEANWPRMTKEVATIDKALELLAAARKVAGDTVYGKRIELVADYVHPLHQLRARLAKGRENVPQALAFERNKADLKLDGRLDDKFWEGLRVYSLSEVETGRVPAFPTTFRAGWAGDAIYLGIRCEERDTRRLHATARKEDDTSIWEGDAVELLLETQVHSYYQIAINPAGAVVDADRKERIDTLWNSHAEAAVYVGEGFWSLEVRLPAAGELAQEVDPRNGLAGRRPSETYPWHFNLCRQRVRGKDTQRSAFSPTGTPGFHDVMKFAELIVK
ncbi:MAG: DUF4838 domain-containing protein [Thermoguttaceae bacterium]